ncbi:MAG: S-layer homology domain-containing protein [Bacillota bacterium]
MGRYRKKLRFLAILLTFCFLTGFVFPLKTSGVAAAADQTTAYSAAEMASKAVDFINQKYQTGGEIDGYTAYVLAMAGEDLASAKWTRNGKNLKSEIENLADLLGDSNSMITYIYSTQNSEGSFGPYANEYGTKAPLQALAAVKDDLTAGSDVYDRVQNSIANAANYFKSRYQNGSMTYAVNGWNFDYRCVEALAKAGEDLSVGGWVYGGTSLKDTVVASACATADAVTADPSIKDAVYLAKELTALYAVQPSSANIGVLADAIIAKQNTTVAGQVYFGSSIYDDVVVLTALGKAGRLGSIDQEKALAYLNTFKHSHTNSWGSPAGAAWGGYYPEESDLTSQVLTALSYFTGANDPDSNVYKAIQDGLAYLSDIQDADIAAVPAQWDSTFATAETLIALKALGKTYNDYAGAGSSWVKRSRTKTVAQCLLALNQWNDTTRLDRLANLLAGRQKAADPGKGSFENSVYSDMWAYMALGEGGKMGNIDTAGARTYILSKQSADGSWGESFGGIYYPDVLSTAQAVRALTYLPGTGSDTDIQAAINKGLAYLKGLQQNDGGVCAQYDDPAVDNSGTVITLRKLSKDPEGAEWTKTVDGKKVNPVSYLMKGTMNADGSFGTSKNVFGAAEALFAYVLQKDVDMVATVKNGVNYLAGQFSSDNTTHMYKQYGGYRAAKVITLAGEDAAADRWKKDGKTLAARITEDAAALKAESDVKDIAKTLIGLTGLKSPNAGECSRLINLIVDKQQAGGNFADGVIYNEMLPYLALTTAGGWGSLAAEKQAKAREWLINAQTKADPDKGSWQHQWGVDTVSTAQATVVLSGFDDAKTVGSATYQAVQDGLAWIRSKQDDTGKISVQFDDPVTDTGEAVLAVLAAGQNPKGAEWTKNGRSLIDYLFLRANQNDDGSIGDKAGFSGNVGSTVPALLAMLEYNKSFGWIDFDVVQDGGNNDDNNQPGQDPSRDRYSVNIAVVGRNGELLYGPDSVTVSKSGKWGLTAMGALHATGLPYTDDGGFVKSIDGQANSGMNGWMYKVNGTVPMMIASSKPVSEGDQVIWWYSKDMNSSGPTWDSLFKQNSVVQAESVTPAGLKEQNKLLPAALQATDSALASLEKVDLLTGLKDTSVELGAPGGSAMAVVVVGDIQPLDLAAIAALKKELARNVVDLTQKVAADKGATVADAGAEVALSIPARALSRDVEITVKKVVTGSDRGSGAQPAGPSGFRQVSAIYDFGPDGINFAMPVTLTLKVAIPPMARPENLALAWYDKSTGKWVTIPAVVDVDKGLILARVQHFSHYAVFAGEPVKSFADVTHDSFGWAKDSIEALAGAGIVSGVNGTHFEPARAVTRAEFAALLVKALGLKAEAGAAHQFKDVRTGDWYAGAITAAYSAGLVKGYGDGTFRPDSTVNREEVAAMLARAMKLQATEQKLPFTDGDKIASWARASVAAAASQGLIKGFPDGTFQPEATAGRAQCAVMVYRMLTGEN